jgi:IS1 family transposase
MRLLVEAGTIAEQFQDQMFRNLTWQRIQVDEVWAFIGAKQKNVTPAIAAKNPDAGDIWLWVAIDADTKIVPCWMLGGRDANFASFFLLDLRKRLSNRVQLSIFAAVDYAFSGDVDLAQLVKLYGESSESDKRYSPAQCIGCKRKSIVGDPDPDHISTSFADRQNLSVRMGIRRYARLTNAFSRKLENHAAAGCALSLRIQLHEDPPHPSGDARDGRWSYKSIVGSVRPGCFARSRRTGVRKSGVVQFLGGNQCQRNQSL